MKACFSLGGRTAFSRVSGIARTVLAALFADFSSRLNRA